MTDVWLFPSETPPSNVRLRRYPYVGVVETVVAMDFPMGFLAEPVVARELRSRVSGASVSRVARDFPEILVKSGKAQELRSKFA